MTTSDTPLQRAGITALPFSALPTIGQPLMGGTFVGVITDKDGTHMAVALLDARPESHLAWAAAMSWADSVGGQLPPRHVAALLYANAKAAFQRKWYWTCDELPADTWDQGDVSAAWFCYFDIGSQYWCHKREKGAAAAVRMIPLTT